MWIFPNRTQPALVAQLVEQVTLNHRVQGSSPCGGIGIEIPEIAAPSGAIIAGIFAFLVLLPRTAPANDVVSNCDSTFVLPPECTKASVNTCLLFAYATHRLADEREIRSRNSTCKVDSLAKVLGSR